MRCPTDSSPTSSRGTSASKEQLIDHLFNSSEKRLARTLVLLARHGTPSAPDGIVLRISQGTLAERIGTDAPESEFLLEPNSGSSASSSTMGNTPLKIHPSRLTTMLQEGSAHRSPRTRHVGGLHPCEHRVAGRERDRG
jgi:hypothetical protein